MASILSSSAMFVQFGVGKALEIIDSNKKLRLSLCFLNHVYLLGIENLWPFAAYFFPAGREFTVSNLRSEEQIFKVHVL